MSPQHPLPAGFGAKATAREVIGERRINGIDVIDPFAKLGRGFGAYSTVVNAAHG